MHNNHPILGPYYSKYQGGNNLSRVVNILSKVKPNTINAQSIIKNTLTEMVEGTKEGIRDIPTKLKEKIIEDVSTDILQGNNPIESLKKAILKRLDKENLSNSEYDNLIKISNIPFNYSYSNKHLYKDIPPIPLVAKDSSSEYYNYKSNELRN